MKHYEVRQFVRTVNSGWLLKVYKGSYKMLAEKRFQELHDKFPYEHFELVEVVVHEERPLMWTEERDGEVIVMEA